MYKRILMKLSGEALRDYRQHLTFDLKHVNGVSDVIKSLHDNGAEIAIIVGAGNIWRGKLAATIGIDSEPADYIGMLGTVINSVAIAANLKRKGVDAVVYSALPGIEGVTIDFDEAEVNKALSEKKVVFIAGGTGKPGFTTDTAAALRALQLNCEAIFMGKNGVDGVYTDDPKTNKDAQFIKTITFDEMIKKELHVMDKTAVELIKDTNIEIRVFSMAEPNNFLRVVNGEDIGTTVKKGE